MESSATDMERMHKLSSMIARAFVHAYRIMKVIIDNGGSNHWLAEGTPHCNLRRDFVNTKYGIKPRVNG